MEIQLNYNKFVSKFSKFLIGWNICLLIAVYFVLPSLRSSQNVDVLSIADFIRTVLVVFDLLMVFLIYKEKIWCIWLIGLSSFCFVILNFLTLKSDASLGFIVFSFLHLADFVLLIFLATISKKQIRTPTG